MDGGMGGDICAVVSKCPPPAQKAQVVTDKLTHLRGKDEICYVG